MNNLKTANRKVGNIPYKSKKGISVSNRSLNNYIKKISNMHKEVSMKKTLFGTFAVLVWVAAIFAVSSTSMMLG